MSYSALGTEAPALHLFVVQLRPHLGRFLDRIFVRKAEGASWPTSSAGFGMNVEKYEVGVWVLSVVSCMVMYCSDKPGYTFA
jgi:hypothetical protein